MGIEKPIPPLPCAPRKGKRLLSVLFEVLGEVPLVGRKTLIFTNRQPTCKMAPWWHLGGERDWWWFRFKMFFFSLTPKLGKLGMIQFEAYFPIGLKSPTSWDWSLNLELLRLYSFVILIEVCADCTDATLMSGKFGVCCFGWNLIISTLASTQEPPKINDKNNPNKPENMISNNIVFSQADFIDKYIIYHIFLVFSLKQGTPRGICLSHTVICCLAFTKPGLPEFTRAWDRCMCPTWKGTSWQTKGSLWIFPRNRWGWWWELVMGKNGESLKVRCFFWL